MEEDLYDSSELIEIYRTTGEAEGYTSVLNLIEFPKGIELSDLNVVYPAREDYDQALVWSAKLLERGSPVPALDVVLAAMSVRLGVRLVTRDRHFAVIKSVARELKLQVKR